MATVTHVSEWTHPESGKVRWYVDLDDGGEKVETVCFSPQAADLKTGEALPQGWVLNPPKQEGWKPMLSAPKKAGGGGGGAHSSWYNSEAGVRFTQERTDRRTALMQAVEAAKGPLDRGQHYTIGDYFVAANAFYSWLRETSGSAPLPSSEARAVAASAGPDPSSATEANRDPSSDVASSTVAEPDPGVSLLSTGSDGAGRGAAGEGEASAAPPHQHSYKTDPDAVGYFVCSCGDRKKRKT